MADDVGALLDLWTSPPTDDDEAVTAFRAVYADPVVVNGVPLTALDLVARARSLRATFEDPQREVLDLVQDGDKVAVASRLTGRHVGPLASRLRPVAATGCMLTLRAIDVLTLEGGRISQIQMVADELGALRGVDAVQLLAAP